MGSRTNADDVGGIDEGAAQFMTTSELLAQQLDDTRDWTLKILADFTGDDWSYQPAPGMGHAVWLCGHLASAQFLLVHQRCLQQTEVLDAEFLSQFPIGGPVKSVAAFDYPPVERIRSEMDRVHRSTVIAVRGMSDALLAEPCFGADGQTPHPHYCDKAGAVSHCSRHEAFHAGQLATIRRMLGKSFLR